MFYFLLSGNGVASTGMPFLEGKQEPVDGNVLNIIKYTF